MEVRASKIGGCVRAYILDKRQEAYMIANPGDPDIRPEVTPRMQLFFDVGKALEPIICKHSGYPLSILLYDKLEIRLNLGPELTLTGHPDGMDEDWIYELKTMRSLSYKKMVATGMDAQFPSYLVQGACYCKAERKKGVRYVCLDKDASHIHKVTWEWDALEPFWKKAQANGLTIQHWLDRKNLPARDPALPWWYCLEAFCGHDQCRYHFSKRRKNPIKQIAPEVVESSGIDSFTSW